ncbi:uncharacterized protein LOC121733700 isoform X3 [Aricia agestis]|uniref:uncharacterized protein LOC121733700 isoform X3 n=1 Tax=Aricia agestis TaxID=91739 RepID=UPI001C20915C|nr:uncharacterized protein LOC121733700 isoform X3 [Aricia agestis]
MFNTVSHRAKLIAHKEGKLKSYESCLDVRAWSHDDDRRSSCLRDWIRGDIPVCVLPVLALTRHLNNMTRKRRTTLVPPCSPECRSKIILDNIYESCHAIEECLRNEEEFQNVFENSYRNISVLQVLHKSNATPADANDHHCDKNPTDVLNRVHERFNAILKRELCIAKENKNYHVDKTSTSYQEMSVSRTSFTSTASKFQNVNG